MKIASMIDYNLEKPHGNRIGLSYGELAVLLLTYIVSEEDHRMCCVETWVKEHHRSLEGITGWKIREKEATDDRCGDLLRTLGSSSSLTDIEKSLCQYLVKAYELPTEKCRSDTTSFSVHHQILEEEEESSVLKFGYSKDKRPDPCLRRGKLKTIPSNAGYFRPSRNASIRETEVGQEDKEIGLGFEVPLGSIWIDPESKKCYQWYERWLVVKSNALASRQIKGLESRFYLDSIMETLNAKLRVLRLNRC